MSELCESCGLRPAVRVLHLAADVDGFAVCGPCDLRALEAERRPAVRYIQAPAGAPRPARLEDERVLAARRALLSTIR